MTNADQSPGPRTMTQGHEDAYYKATETLLDPSAIGQCDDVTWTTAEVNSYVTASVFPIGRLILLTSAFYED